MIVDVMTGALVSAVLTGSLLAIPVEAATGPAGHPRPGTTELVSGAADGSGGAGRARTPSLAAGGRYVAFSSDAANLVSGDTNGRADVFVTDRRTGAVERVSVGTAGAGGTGSSLRPAVSGDGRFVAFQSTSPNLVAGDTNGTWDVFVRDREADTTVRVSVGSSGLQADSGSGGAAVSANGRFVAFTSDATNLVAGDTNGRSDIFVHDLRTGVTQPVSADLAGDASDGGSFAPSFSADGRFVTFWSAATDLVDGDTNGRSDVFLHDRERGTTELVSTGPDGQGNGHAYYASVSADGRYVAFESWASNLVPSDTNKAPDIFVRDRSADTTERVSVGSGGAEGDGYSFAPSISGDGRFVGFYSLAGNLVPGDDGVPDVFVRDRATGATELVSRAGDGTAGNAGSSAPELSGDGSLVAFSSQASNLVPGDRNGTTDAFVRDRGQPLGAADIRVADTSGRALVSGWATFSGQEMTATDDPTGDAGGTVGADLTRAGVAYRPEHADLLLTLRVASLPWVAVQECRRTPTFPPFTACVEEGSGGGAPGVVYGLSMRVGQTRYEVRVVRRTSAQPHVGLYRCEPGCAETATLSGGIGTTGPEVTASLPLAAIGATEGTRISGLRGYTASGDAASGDLATLDEIALPDTSLPVSWIRLGVVRAGEPVEEAVLRAATTPDRGRFSATLEVSGLPPGTFRVWARACLGDRCGDVAAGAPEIVVPRLTSAVEVTIRDTGRYRLLVARLTGAGGTADPLPGRTVVFTVDGEPAGTATTDADGVATAVAPPRFRGAHHTVAAVFGGDDTYLPARDIVAT